MSLFTVVAKSPPFPRPPGPATVSFNGLSVWGNIQEHEYPDSRHTKGKVGADQPATRSESKSEGNEKPQPEAEGRSR